MVLYITLLRALSAMIITNAHYTGIYPTDLIANGGLLGDVIFFAVSGFCLANIRLNFGRWYIKRICRIYPAVIIITAIYLIIGLYKWLGEGIGEFIHWFVYPTNYHFVASIIVLYIPYYFIKKYIIRDDYNSDRKTLICFFTVLAMHILTYIFVYDKTYYHIDNVREPFIRFLFFESMLLGLYFKIKHVDFTKDNKKYNWLCTTVVFVIYFISKTLFSHRTTISQFQIVNQIVLLILLFFVFKSFAGIEEQLKRMPKKLYILIKYIADITLEIYVVQYALIPIFRNAGVFPLNWMATTVSVFVTAAILHYLTGYTDKFLKPFYNK